MQNINFTIFVIISMSLILYITSCSNSQQNSSEDNAIADSNPEAVVKHGEYLTTILGCNDCHSPKKMGPNGPEIIAELMLSGYPSDRPIVKFVDPLIKQGFGMFYPDLTAAAGPWGVSFAGNLTPDETGIGDWTEEQFKKAITQGKYKGMDGGRMLLPPMPWLNYARLTDEDVNAMFMYLQTIKPVNNIVPSPISPDLM